MKRFLSWCASWFRRNPAPMEVEREPTYDGMPEAMREKLIAQDKERKLVASREHEFAIIEKVSKAMPGVIMSVHANSRGVTVYATLESFKDGLAPLYRQFGRFGYRVHKRYDPSSGQVNTEFKNGSEAIIDVYATSRACKRVQTGTRLEEVAVYETQCE